tara:strand:- start:995 stop:1303 length:309 start_codon:yes stop_codon:yes gene_type:complete
MEQEEPIRLRLPRNQEIFGIIDQRLGASRLRVKCLDGKTRICRIPGRMKKYLWVREGNIVLVEPWEYGGDEKGDIVYKYKPNQADALKRQGKLKAIENVDEF